jgi:hypothetical protein
MPPEFPGVPLWGVPGLVVWLVGQALVFRTRVGPQRSPLGQRLSRIGFAILTLGVMVGLATLFSARGQWPIAVVVIIVLGWWPLRLLLAARTG